MEENATRLREYGEAENQHIIATIFNPKTPLHHDLDYLEETAEYACDQAKRAFGVHDAIYFDARINAGLFFAYRLADQTRAQEHLDKAIVTTADLSTANPVLLAKLNLARALAAEVGGASLTGAFTFPEGDAQAPRQRRDEVAKFASMAAATAQSNDPVVRFLLWKMALPIAYELVSVGHALKVVQVLSGDIYNVVLELWGADSGQVKKLKTEIRWIKDAGDPDAFPAPAMLQRFRRKITRGLNSFPESAEVPDKFRRLFDQFRSQTEQVVQSDDEYLLPAMSACEESIRALLDALERDGLYSDILNSTDALFDVASTQMHADDKHAEMEQSLAADVRDQMANTEVGEVIQVPLGASVVNPGQASISRDHAVWMAFGGIVPDSTSVAAQTVLVPGLEVLADLYGLASDPSKQAQSIVLRRLALRVLHAMGAHGNDVHRLRVDLAQALLDGGEGDLGEIADAVLVHTDSLDFEEGADPYTVALGKALRGIGFWLRASTAEHAAPWPLDDDGLTRMDMMMAGSAASEVFDVFQGDAYPLEEATLMYAQTDALLTKLPGIFADEEAENADEDDEESHNWIKSSFHALNAAELAFGPVRYPERWLDIQIMRARLCQTLIARGIDINETPKGILLRAKALLSHIPPGLLHLRLDTALATHGQISVGSLKLSKIDTETYRHTGHHDLHALKELVALATRLFEQGDFVGSAPILKTAQKLGESIMLRGGSAKVLRVAAHQIGQVTQRLAYCHHKASNFVCAAQTLEAGRALTLRASLDPELINWVGVDDDTRKTAEALFDERQLLLTRSESSISFIEDIDRLHEIQSDLGALLGDQIRSSMAQAAAFETLAVAEPGAVLAIPLITEFGSAVYMIPSGADNLTESDVIALPDLTTADLRKWLSGGDAAGWIERYEKRNRSRMDRRRFQSKIVEISDELHENFMGALCGKVLADGYSSIVLIPTNGLQLLPLQAAANGGVEDRLSGLDQVSIRTVPSATIYGVLRNRKSVPPTQKGLVAGVATYEHEAWGDLEFAEVETRIIADQMGIPPLLNEDVTPEALAERSHGTELVHLACHGASWATDPNFFTGFSAKPMLILESSGVTTTAIQMDWNLSGTKLACLSGCDTGLIDLSKPWDEFEGLSNMLIAKGAQAVLASLWSVDDKSTALLMGRLYKNMMSDNLAPSAALLEAQAWLRSTSLSELKAEFPRVFEDASDDSDEMDGPPPFAHPFYWAPFTMMG